MRRIGVYDPAFNVQGHFVAFDRYVAELLDQPDVQVVYLDSDNLMRDAYEGKNTLTSPPEFICVDTAEQLSQTKSLSHRIANLIRRYNHWRRVLRAIADQQLDLVLITSESYDPFFYLSLPRFTYGLFILNPRLYIYKPTNLPNLIRKFLFSLYAFRYWRWARNATFLVTTNEPPMIPDLEQKLGVKTIPWLPNLYLSDETEDRTVTQKEYVSDFLTIGTISRSKNHLFALRTFRDMRLPYTYTVAGLARDSIGTEVEKTVHKLQLELSIKGVFGYIDEAAYVELIKCTKFMLLPYDFARGNISSQVMHECFIYGTPIVAPDIHPFKWYIERYGIGLIYKEGDSESLAQALAKAIEIGPDAFMGGFKELRRDNSLENARNILSALYPTNS